MMFEWCEKLGVLARVNEVRSWEIVSLNRPPDVILYSWPDAAWVASGTFLFAGIWSGSKTPARYLWISLPTALAVGGEVAQAAGICPGTFDIADLFLCALAGPVAFFFSRILHHEA